VADYIGRGQIRTLSVQPTRNLTGGISFSRSASSSDLRIRSWASRTLRNIVRPYTLLCIYKSSRQLLDRWAANTGRSEGATAEKAVPFPGAVRRSLVVLRFAALDPFTRRGFLRLFLPMLDDF
jgi:hypothetical protein